MPETTKDNSQLKAVQDTVKKIWLRARSNAFAHREAAEEYKKLSSEYFRRQVFAGIGAILLVLLAYISSTFEKTWVTAFQLPLIFTIGSVFSAAFSLYQTIMQNYFGYEILYKTHDLNQHSYLYLSQRAREVQWPDIGLEKAIATLEDLERDFQTLKVRGSEPSNEHFNRGNGVLMRLRKGAEHEMQSFEGVQEGIDMDE